MTLDITTQTLIIDETVGLDAESDDALTTNTLINYMKSKTAGTAGDMTAPEVAIQTNFVTATASAGETIVGVSLVKADGTAFSTTVGVNSGLTDVDGNPIWLFKDPNSPAGTEVIIGVIGTSTTVSPPAPTITTPLAFALALVPTSSTTGDLYVVQHVALENPLFPDNYDEPVDLGDTVFAGVTATTSVSFDGDQAPPGKNEFYLLNSNEGATQQILVTGFNRESTSLVNAIPNVSTQGFGIDNQSINPAEVIEVDFVSGGTQSAGKLSQISYSKHTNGITTAGFTVNQITHPVAQAPGPISHSRHGT